ncbi:MAG: nucleotidyltransferase domain-containing protein [Planctomycetes bacterium]|nr:nucleotidyltransferase domain-containing protein [Planctomycetota bacterium]MBU4399249.1 nucleotidyltransferase domain-containing protein [Planctomycetota bacterium]MCG2684701.1 nucleotidyltransferase domain-containing protein [Planctomycetales bacterium]
MIDQAAIAEAVNLLLKTAPAGSEVILFGSHARGEAGSDSDLDFLVVEPTVKSKRAEMVRLRDALRPLRIPVDVLVTSREVFEDWRDTPNNVLFEAWNEGRSFHEVG